MMLHERDSTKIRRDSLKMVIQKANAGCLSCAQSYFELARKHGATGAEIERAIDNAAEQGGKGLNRRELLKLVSVVAAGVALGTSGLLAVHAAASTAAYWGTDSNSATCAGIPQNFYIGRFGYGTTGSTLFFNTAAAQAAGKSSTYIYWGLEGPGSRPRNTTPYNWGLRQVQAAIYQWSNNANAAYVGGQTIFADIEAGFGGWKGGNSRFYYNNRQVVKGFLDTIVSSFHPGIYITFNDWGYYLGTPFKPGKSFVLWIAGCLTCSSSICAPCSLGAPLPKPMFRSSFRLSRAQFLAGHKWYSGSSGPAIAAVAILM